MRVDREWGSRRWWGICIGLAPSVLSLVAGVLDIPPRVIDFYDDTGRIIDHGNNDFFEDRWEVMVPVACFGYALVGGVVLLMTVMDLNLRVAANVAIGLGVGFALLAVGAIGQGFLDTYV